MQKFKIGDNVVRVRRDNGTYEPIGTTARVVGVSDGNWLSLVLTSGPRAGESATWLIMNVALNDPLEEAKRLLESKGYKVEVPKNEIIITEYTKSGDRVLWQVTPDGINRDRVFNSLGKLTMDKLVEAWAQVKAEEARRNSTP